MLWVDDNDIKKNMTCQMFLLLHWTFYEYCSSLVVKHCIGYINIIIFGTAKKNNNSFRVLDVNLYRTQFGHIESLKAHISVNYS